MADILFPAGRMIGGSVDKLFEQKENGKPKLDANGQPVMKCSIGVAIPKGAEKHWSETPWGATIYQTGAAAHPNMVANPAFSWKITDGDSNIPNQNGKKPCDQTGYPGNWVVWFSQGWLPKRCNADGSVELPEGSIVAGYYIQVFGSITGNKIVQGGKAGVYLNPIAVALVGEGDKIASDVDTAAVGFGSALPAGARPVAAAVPAFQPPVPAPVPVVPNPAFLAPVPPPAAPVGPQMTAKAAGGTYQSFRAAGWTDEAMRSDGYLV